MTRARGAIAWAAMACGAWLAGRSGAARAQPIDPVRPRTFVIGVPAGARIDRVDVARSGLSRTPLPSSGLHVEWRASIGASLDHGPLVDARGSTYVVTTRGEAVAIARDGTDRWRLLTTASDPGPAALLSDDTLVFVDAGDAIGVRDGAVRWRSHIGVAGAAPAGPLPLDDGGVVVTTGRDLALLDAEGHERARTVLPEPAAAPLLWAIGQVVVVASSGAVWTWTPGAAEPARVAAFGSPTEGGAALAGDHTLVAVVAGQTTLASIDLLHGNRAPLTRAVATGGLWLGPPALRGDATTVTMLGATAVAVTIDAGGRELGRAFLAGRLPASRADAGVAAAAGLVMPLLVDPTGTLAFATYDGGVGASGLGAAPAATPAAIEAAEAGRFELLGDVCPRTGIPGAGGSAGPVAGLAPLPPGSLVVACHSGALVAIEGAAGASTSGRMRPSTL